jgi:serine/threonine-protein kinase
VVFTYEVGEHKGSYFIAMEYLDGQPLDKLLKANDWDLPLRPAVRILALALAGLHYAHELRDYDGSPLNVVHRDVSPHNVFVTYDGLVKLVDFGIAKAALNSTRTESGVLKGKLAYMAPEQGAGDVIVDRRADVFSAGVMLWEILAKRPMRDGGSVKMLYKLIHEDAPPLPADADPTLASIAMRALASDRERRFASAEEMRLALEAWLGDPPPLAPVLCELFDREREERRRLIEQFV